ncbi:hypothetical protein [Rhizobium alvei]|uniref:Uncharacterized protein n=1 Tax=Rhizobium alvei TaxID=1132659 RepID=A0ABT8YMR7_9HYPH|nr:hypothetical protein [Rhizobium alvei]MDO6964901.1 hypothetical protein [Rhizobium alvei]
MLRALAALLIASSVLPAQAASCRQEHAVYRDSDNAYELAFEPVDSEASSSSHRFTLKVLNKPVVLEGYVLPSEPVNRPNGMIFYNCPEGDVTGADLAACTVWQGVIYAHYDAHIDLLPPQGSAAAAQILLPGFGPSVRASNVWGKDKAMVVPWDVLTLKDCNKMAG